MSCAAVQRELTAYLDGELDTASASALRGHLRLCPDCRAAAEDHAAIRDRLAELERPEPPPALWHGVLARLGEAEIADARRPRWARLLERLRPHLVPAGLAATACAVAVLVIQLRAEDDAAPAGPVVGERATAGAPGAGGADPDGAALDVARGAALGGGNSGGADPGRGDRAVPFTTHDATAELAAEAARLEERWRVTTAELLPLARGELRGTARRRFDREVAALQAQVLRTPAGRDRDRAWHALVMFLERAALGEVQVAVHP